MISVISIARAGECTDFFGLILFNRSPLDAIFAITEVVIEFWCTCIEDGSLYSMEFSPMLGFNQNVRNHSTEAANEWELFNSIWYQESRPLLKSSTIRMTVTFTDKSPL
jgi:hypothetical protein